VAPNKQNDREARQARERLRAYQARQTVHEAKARRRVRDNWLAGIGVLVVVVLAVLTQLLYFNSGPGKPVASPSPSASAAAYSLPPKTLAGNRQWTGTMTINSIPLGISLDGAKAPQAVSSTIALSQKGFYNGLTCHRLTTSGIYVLQCGDPKGDGTGGPGYTYGPVENAPPTPRAATPSSER
jgi:peptidyl-prolyl cis-trans isomerase B (cyclophilin B)